LKRLNPKRKVKDCDKWILYLAVLLISTSVVSLACTFCNSLVHFAGVITSNAVAFKRWIKEVFFSGFSHIEKHVVKAGSKQYS
jgi:hypothetical protein